MTYPLPELEPVLRETYGRILFQDQVLDVVRVVGGLSAGRGGRVPEGDHARPQQGGDGAAGPGAVRAGEGQGDDEEGVLAAVEADRGLQSGTASATGTPSRSPTTRRGRPGCCATTRPSSWRRCCRWSRAASGRSRRWWRRRSGGAWRCRARASTGREAGGGRWRRGRTAGHGDPLLAGLRAGACGGAAPLIVAERQARGPFASPGGLLPPVRVPDAGAAGVAGAGGGAGQPVPEPAGGAVVAAGACITGHRQTRRQAHAAARSSGRADGGGPGRAAAAAARAGGLHAVGERF